MIYSRRSPTNVIKDRLNFGGKDPGKPATVNANVVETSLVGSRAYSPQIGLRNIGRSAPRFWRCDARTSAMASLLTRPVTTSGDSAPASRGLCFTFRYAGQSRTPGTGPATTY